MLQFLLNDYLPNYNLPKRRLTADRWTIDPITTKVIYEDYTTSFTYDKDGSVVAIKLVGEYLAILYENGVEAHSLVSLVEMRWIGKYEYFTFDMKALHTYLLK